MAFQILYGLDIERLSMTDALEVAELFYSTDTKKLWIGDGATIGGISAIPTGLAASKNVSDNPKLEIDSFGTPAIPDPKALLTRDAIKTYIDNEIKNVDVITINASAISTKADVVVATGFLTPGFNVKLPNIMERTNGSFDQDVVVPPGKKYVIRNDSSSLTLEVRDLTGTSYGTLRPGHSAVFFAQSTTLGWATAGELYNDFASAPLINPLYVPVRGSISLSNGDFLLYTDKADITSVLGLQNLAFKNTVASTDIDTSAVITAKIANAAVTLDKIANASVSSDKLTTGAVTSTKIAANAVDGTHIAAASINGTHIDTLSIDNSHIIDNTITVTKIADIANTLLVQTAGNTVSGTIDLSTGIYDLDVDTAVLGLGSLAYLNTVDTAQIQPLAIQSTLLAAQAVTTIKIADNAVTSAKIAASAVLTEHLGLEQVTTNKIEDDAVTHRKVADDAVSNDKIQDGTIKPEKLDELTARARLIPEYGSILWPAGVALPTNFFIADGNNGTNNLSAASSALSGVNIIQYIP